MPWPESFKKLYNLSESRHEHLFPKALETMTECTLDRFTHPEKTNMTVFPLPLDFSTELSTMNHVLDC